MPTRISASEDPGDRVVFLEKHGCICSVDSRHGYKKAPFYDKSAEASHGLERAADDKK